MDNLDMLKSLVKTLELISEENRELRDEIKELKERLYIWNNLGLPPVTDKGE